MSQAMRDALVASPFTIFRSDSQRDDLRDPSKTQTGLIALLSDLVAQRHYLLFTAIRSDHHDDSYLGQHCHANGYCADLWLLNSPGPADYVGASDARFAAFLKDATGSKWLYQIGLAGTADTLPNRLACGLYFFADSGADHVHLGAHN